jgi:hypothetical protein
MANISDMVGAAQAAPSGQTGQQPSGPPQPGAAPQQGGALQQLMQPQPAPSARETITAMKHFSTIAKRLEKILNSDGCGKADCKSQLWDAAADLVGEGILSTSDALNEMKTLPTNPPDQKAWLQKHIMNAKMAEVKVITDHLKANPGTGNPQQDMQPIDNSDGMDHGQIMQGMMQRHYGGKK